MWWRSRSDGVTEENIFTRRQKRRDEKLREEANLCKKLRKGNISKDGYVIDRFFVDDDTGETTGVEETDDLFAKADTIENYSSDEEDEEWEEC